MARAEFDRVADQADGCTLHRVIAVVVDDAFQGVDEVVRGDDLLPATPLQVLLHEFQGLVASIARALASPRLPGRRRRSSRTRVPDGTVHRIWTLSTEVRAMTAHVVVEGEPTLAEAQIVGSRVKGVMVQAFAEALRPVAAEQ